MADTKTSALTALAGASVEGTDLVPIVDGSATATKKITVAELAIAITALGNLATDTEVANAVAALVASAPGALDTLDELAAALGDDASFATTVTNALAGKVAASLYDAHTVLVATSDNTPAAVTMGASTILARLAAGNIKAASPAEIKTLLAVTAADVAFTPAGTIAATTVQAAIEELDSEHDLVTFVTVTDADRTLQLSDRSKIITLSSSSAHSVTVPPNSSVAFPVGTQIGVMSLGSGTKTVASGVGVTVTAAPGADPELTGVGAIATLVKYATDTWILTGDLANA